MALTLRVAINRLPVSNGVSNATCCSNTSMMMMMIVRKHGRQWYTQKRPQQQMEPLAITNSNKKARFYASAPPPAQAPTSKSKELSSPNSPPPPEMARSTDLGSSTSKTSTVQAKEQDAKKKTTAEEQCCRDDDHLADDGFPTSTATPAPKPQQPVKKKLSREAVRENVKGYVFTRYFDYVKNYDKVLEKNFPSAMKVYRVFFDGVKDFFADMKRYLKVSRIAHNSAQGLAALNRKELELYMQMPRDMVKVAPTLIFSSLPFVGYAIFPLAFMYPKKLLCSHFWTLQQRAEFKQQILHERLLNNRQILRYMQAKLKTVRKQSYHSQLSEMLGLLGSGFHPSIEAILEVKDAFASPPYCFNSLSGKHVKLLCHLHGMGGGFFKRFRLAEHAFVLHHMDLAIMREGGVHNMPIEALRRSCYIRGLNPANLADDEMIDWLRNWIHISTTIKERHISLFLHLPILMGYNHPNNWQLIYGRKK